MSTPYTLYAWELSLYSGKVRAYLRFKNLPFVERRPNLLDMRRIRREVHATVMPVLVTPGGEWIQDTSAIIDALEQRHPEVPIVPPGPRQRLAAYLLEAWGDEFWLPPAMHYRWNFAENYDTLFRIEAGDNLLPWMPRVLKNRVAARSAGMLRGFCPGLGVVPEQTALIERWTQDMCDALDAHFARHPYLLGSRPSLGDYGLIGPLYAHLGRDPFPRRALIAPRRHLADWVRRMQHPPEPLSGEFLPGDEVPQTLTPVFDSIFGEFWPQLIQTQNLVEKAVSQLAPGRGLARQLGAIRIPYAGDSLELQSRPFSLWMVQRVFEALEALDEPTQAEARTWLDALSGGRLFDLRIQPRLRRLALRVAPVSEAQ